MAKKDGELTPLMKQYWDIKSLHQDKILLFRMGDFYELFYDDAVKASPLLGITLTQRNKKSEDQTPMCGFPHHAVAGPINKLLAAGFKVAICDQVEDPATAKGIVKRAITRILTPGMVYDSETLDQSKAHYLTAIDDNQISFVDTTTGECFYFSSQNINEKLKLLEVLPVAELVVADKNEKWLSETKISERIVVSEFKEGADSAGKLLGYVKSLANAELIQILRPFVEREFEHRLHLSQTTLRHLEVFSNFKGEANGSLYHAINRTKTSSGARLLRQWMCFPLRNKKQIESRFDQIESFRNHMLELKKVREALGGMGDIERRLGKIAQPQCNGRDLTALSGSIDAGLAALNWCETFFIPSQQVADLKKTAQLSREITERIVEEAPLSVKQGHIIKSGFSAELDELVNLSTNAHSLIENLERREKERTGITSLKVRYNNVFGYYIEVTNLHKDKVPADYQRKQTLANAERFCTEELIELEKKVLSAQVKRFDLEFALFDQLRRHVLEMAPELLALAQLCSELDVVSALSWLSLEQSYCRPVIRNDRELLLENCRHPVVEQFTGSSFVPNTVKLNQSECLLLTGPNMAGKSTLMRQVALNVLLAQMGSYVPAIKAELPVYDAVYTRIGASDQLSEGLSTFMVEMTETAQMLKSATQDSLLILDEVGRGTATFDGMCLAQAILEHIVNTLKNHVLFATHYHELTALQTQLTQIKNAHMKVLDHGNGQIEFLHVLTPGPAGKSYGVQVAELAGVPADITKRAAQLLKVHEADGSGTVAAQAEVKDMKALPVVKSQMSLFDREEEEKKQKLIDDVKKFSVQKSSPLQALNKIAEWQDNLN
jgi:DNA mismatch repair protein MutS